MNYELSRRFPAKRAFITGAGGALGRTLAVALARDGWCLGLADLDVGRLAETKALVEESGGRAFTFRFDVADAEAFRGAFESFVASAGGLDLMINNAGVGDGGLFGDYSLADWQWIIGVNQMSAIYGSHFAARLFRQQRSGHLISVASAGGFANLPEMSMYNVGKAAVISLMETLHAELRPFGISVSVVCPTFFRSEIMRFHRGDPQTTALGESVARHARHTPEEVAEFVLTRAGRRRFYLLFPVRAKLAFFLTHYFRRTFRFVLARFYSRERWRRLADWTA